MPIKTFRGLLADGAQDTIRLSTNNGLTGYQIKKLQLMPHQYGSGSNEQESVVKVFTLEQDSVDTTIDLANPLVIAASILNNDTSAHQNPTVLTTVIDHVVVNQDIYITHKNNHSDAAACSWYLELEQIKLDVNEAAVATLKDMRANS